MYPGVHMTLPKVFYTVVFQTLFEWIDFLLTHLEPLLDIVEGFLVGHVVHHDDPVGAPIVAGGDGAEPLLACRVPDLKRQRLAKSYSNKRGSNLKLDSLSI
jgi:hypothetical protein